MRIQRTWRQRWWWFLAIGSVGVVWTSTFLRAQAQQPRAVTPSVSRAADASPATAFVDIAVIPMDREQVLLHQTVVVRGNRIVALGPTAQVPVPPTAQQIDGRGKFLLPGLADMHIHWITPDSLTLWRILATGVTTVRDMHAHIVHSSALAAKRAVAQGKLLGPRIYTAGDLTEGMMWNPYPMRVIGDGVQVPQINVLDTGAIDFAALADTVAAVKRAGHDFLKVYDMANPAYDSLVAAARRVGLRLVGHTPSMFGRTALAAGADVPLERVLHDPWASIEHVTGYWAYTTGLSEYDVWSSPSYLQPILDTAAWARPDYVWATQPKLQEIVAATQRAGIWQCPTLSAYVRLGEGATPYFLRFMFQLTKMMQEAGVGLLLGTDQEMPKAQPVPPIPPRATVAEELRLMVEEAKLTPYQALATGTRNVAAFLGTLDSTGTVAVGKRADLLVLNGNPLQDIRATASQAEVMVGGRWLTRAVLDAGKLSEDP